MNRITGAVLTGLVILVVLREWGAEAVWLAWTRAGVVVGFLALAAARVERGRQAFVAVAVLLSAALVLVQPDGSTAILMRAFDSAAFIGAYFCALSSLQFAASRAVSVRDAGRFLATQPPGRRYLALTFGTQLFALLLNYGAIALLGSLATAAAREEPNPEIRFHRTRRMLIAIQRGFISVLPWSPLSFAVAVTVSLVPGASWGMVAVPGLVSALILAGVGLALDTVFKPRLSQPSPPRGKPEGSWALLLPLGVLFAALGAIVWLVFSLTQVRVVGIVLVAVPGIALVWLAIQSRSGGASVRAGLAEFFAFELAGYRGQLVLLMMAGFIGTVGAPLLLPLVGGWAQGLADLPGWVTLVALVWIVPLGGQLGMNPILVASLILPLLPAAAAMGVSAQALSVALICGWTVSGATSPFTATTVLIGSMGGVSARHVGLKWNGGYALVVGVVLSLWVVLFAWATGQGT